MHEVEGKRRSLHRNKKQLDDDIDDNFDDDNELFLFHFLELHIFYKCTYVCMYVYKNERTL